MYCSMHIRVDTLMDSIIKGIKKVKGQERCALLTLSALLSVQLGLEHSELYALLSPNLLTLVRDPTLSTAERAAVSIVI